MPDPNTIANLPVDDALAPSHVVTKSGTSSKTRLMSWSAFTGFLGSLFAPVDSPTFTGTPAVPTAAPGTDTTQIASTAFANAAAAAAVTNLIDGAPAALDTLNEIAAALADDADLAGTLSAAIAAKLDKVLTLNAQTGTSYTLVLTDAAKLVTLDNASGITLTVPPNADVAFEVGTQILLRQIGAGQVTIAPGSGVTLQSYGSHLSLAGQHAGCTLIKEATNTWSLQGNLVTP